MIDAILMMFTGSFWILFNIIIYCWIILEVESNINLRSQHGFKIMIVSTIYLILNSAFVFFFISAGYHDYMLMRE